MRDAKIIINPTAGGHSVRKEWLLMKKYLQDTGLPFDFEYTRSQGHATEIARVATDKGYPIVVAVGGDGTINEVVNGILASPKAKQTALGILSAGTACSLSRTLDIPHDYASACALLLETKRRVIDIGVVNYTHEGQATRRYFINEADVGFGAEVVLCSKDFPNNLGRNINYAPFIVSAARSIFSYRNKLLNICMDDQPEYQQLCAILVVSNGSYYAGGMYVAPHARIDDGLLNLMTIGDVEIAEFIKLWIMSYEGQHVKNDKVTLQTAVTVSVKSADKALVEADGELLGECPASFSIIPSALTVIA